MSRKEKKRLLGAAFEGLADPDEEARLAELLRTDPAVRKAYEEARVGHEALLDDGPDPMPAQLLEKIRQAVEREPLAEAESAVRTGATLRERISRARLVFPAGRMPAPARPARVLAFTVLAALLAAAIWQLVPERVAARRSIAVVGFRNETGDTALDYLQQTIPNLLITSLEQSGSFDVTTMQRFKDLLRQMGKDPQTATLDEQTALEICRRAGIEAIAVGSYTRTGNTITMVVKVLETASGRPLETAQSRGEGLASILQTQVDELVRAVTRDEKGSAPKPAGPASRVIDATTSSLEAYNHYLRGLDELERYLFADARRSFEKAVAIDPTFAVAHLYLARAYERLGEYKAQEATLKEAKRFASKATERESLYIEASYASSIEDDADKRYRILRDLVEKYPEEKQAYFELGSYYKGLNLWPEALAAFQKALALDPAFGPAINQMAYVYVELGQYEEAMAWYERYAALNPGDPNPIDSIAEMYFRMGRIEESAAMYRQVVASHPDYVASWLALAYVSALQEDYAEVDRCLEEFTAHAPSAGMNAEGRWVGAFYDFLLGRYDKALEGYRSLGSDMAGIPYWRGATSYMLGFIHSERGEYDLAIEAFDAWASWLESSTPSSMVWILLARSALHSYVDLKRGRLDSVRETLAEMERLLPAVQSADLAHKTFVFQSLRAELALASNSIDEAVSIAEGLVPEIPSMNTPSLAMVNTPPLSDLLARAYWKKGDLDRAQAEYEKLTKQAPPSPGKLSLRLVHPLYHYKLGRVLEEKQDWRRARDEYEKFLKLWKDADPGHPELADARQRLARLPGTS